MTEKINQIRKRKYDSEFDNPKYFKIKGFATMFIILAACGWLVVLYGIMKHKSIYFLHNMYLFATSTGCLVMSIAYLIMRSKLRKLDKYQEEIVQCVYDSLEMFNNHIQRQGQQIKRIEEKLDTAAEQHIKLRSELSSNLYLQFRHYMCPTMEDFRALAGTLETDITEVGLRDELYQKLQDHYITTPLSFFKSENWLLQADILNDDEYYETYKAIHAKYPVLKELDRVPNLLLNISDSMEDYQL